MASRIPRWLKAVGFGLVTVLVVASTVIPTDRFKNWFISQMTFPRGPVGWVFARWTAWMNLRLYDVFSAAADLLELEPDDELVHIGCQEGAFLDTHAKHVKRVAGLDMSELPARMAQKRLSGRMAAGTAEIVQGDPGNLPWDDSTFTAAACIDATLMTFPDADRALAEMYRTLRPGGRLVVDIGIDENDEACVKECDWWGIPHPPEEDARKMVEDAGFALVSISYLDHGYLARFLTGIKPD